MDEAITCGGLTLGGPAARPLCENWGATTWVLATARADVSTTTGAGWGGGTAGAGGCVGGAGAAAAGAATGGRASATTTGAGCGALVSIALVSTALVSTTLVSIMRCALLNKFAASAGFWPISMARLISSMAGCGAPVAR